MLAHSQCSSLLWRRPLQPCTFSQFNYFNGIMLTQCQQCSGCISGSSFLLSFSHVFVVQRGGAINLVGGTMTLNSTSVTRNRSGGSSAIHAGFQASLTLMSCLLSHNTQVSEQSSSTASPVARLCVLFGACMFCMSRCSKWHNFRVAR